MMKYLNVILGTILVGYGAYSQAADCSGKNSSNWPNSRNVLEWPFAEDSIWNMPIGCNARYVDARLNAPDIVGIDLDIFVVADQSDPEVPVYWAGGIDGNTSKFVYGNDVDRCRGRVELDAGARIKFPRDFILPSKGKNYSAAITTPDKRYIYQMNAMARCQSGGPVYGIGRNFTSCREDLQGDGNRCNGGHGGTGMSSIGGTLRAFDFRNDEPIRHALKISLAVFQYYLASNPKDCDHRWPARRCDNHGVKYKGADSEPSARVYANRQGALLAIPPGVSARSLGIKSRAGEKLFDAFQDYGAYTVDGGGGIRNAIRNTFTATEEAVTAFQRLYGHPMEFDMRSTNYFARQARNQAEYENYVNDVRRIFSALHVVDDNSPQNVGGAGSMRRRPLAPGFDGKATTPTRAVQETAPTAAPMPPKLIQVTTE